MALAALALDAAAAPLFAQKAESTEVLLAVLRQERQWLPRGSVALDPGPLCTARLTGWSCPPEVRETLNSLGVKLSSRAFSHVCLAGPRSCRLLGTDVLVYLSPPVVRDREAEVLMDVWRRTTDPDLPVRQERTRVHLDRGRDGWQVTRREPVGG